MNTTQVFPLFAEKPFLLFQRLTGANTARDGSGSVSDLLRQDGNTFYGGRVYVSNASVDTSTDRITLTVPDLTYATLQIKNGTIVTFMSGTLPTGVSLNTEYQVIDLVIASTTSITFKLIKVSDWTLVNFTTAGSDYVMAIHLGSRIDRITFTSAQATAAAAAANRFVVLLSNLGGTYRMRAEIAQATVTASTTAIGATSTFFFAGGLIVPTGCKVAVFKSIGTGDADTYDVIAEGADF